MTDKPVMPELTQDTYTREEVETLLQDAVAKTQARMVGISEVDFKPAMMAKHIVDAAGGKDDTFTVVEVGDDGRAMWKPRSYDIAIADIGAKLDYMFDRFSHDFKLEGNAVINKAHNYRMWVELAKDRGAA